MADEVSTNFEEAFNKLAELETGANAAEVDAKMGEVAQPETPAAPAPETVAEPAPDAQAQASDAPEPAAEPETVEAETEPTEPEPEPAKEAQPALTDDDLLKRFASLVKNAQPEQPQPVKQPEPQPAPQATPDPYTPEEKEFLSSYEKDWPDVAKAEALRRRAEYQQLVGYVFQEVAKVLQPQMEVVRTLSEQTQLQQLQARVTDYEDIRDKVIDWADKQPPYLRAAYQHVIQQGTVDEVSDLINRYRQESGAAASPQVAKPAPRRAPELNAATKQAAAALAPVSSKRTSVIQGDDPNDFESAFQSFAAKA